MAVSLRLWDSVNERGGGDSETSARSLCKASPPVGGGRGVMQTPLDIDWTAAVQHNWCTLEHELHSSSSQHVLSAVKKPSKQKHTIEKGFFKRITVLYQWF